MIILFDFNQRDISQNFMHILIHVILVCLLHLNKKKNGKLLFLDVEVSRQQGKFVTTVYRKPTFTGAYSHFDSFLPTVYKFLPTVYKFLPAVYKFGMIYTLAYRCFKICSDRTKFHEELNFLKPVFSKNKYPLSFIGKCFKTVINKLIIKRLQITTVEKKTLILSLPYLGDISLKTRTKLRKSFKGIFNCCKLQIVMKSQRKFAFKGNSLSDSKIA